MMWSFDSLWQKAKLYMQRALAAERDGALFPFWATLALEFLGRATLARIHPTLLADPEGQAGDNLFYACGYPSPKQPRSIMAKTVFLRCQRVVADFTHSEGDFCLALIDRRNRELHTGDAAFEDYGTQLWLAEFYRIAKLLLHGIGKNLIDFVGNSEAGAAEEMILAVEGKAKKTALDAIAAAKRTFDALGRSMQNERQEQGSSKAVELRKFGSIIISCPSCGARALLSGKTVSASEPRLEDGVILQEHVMLPVRFQCFSCGLILDGHAKLYGAELGGQYSITEEHNPVEFLRIDVGSYFDPADYFEEEYGND
jgi:hypothetical protein